MPSEFLPDRFNAKEPEQCPKCRSAKLKKTLWKPAGFVTHTPTRKAMEKYGVGCVIEWNCPDCGFTHEGNLIVAEA